ncbi:hypothetical protein MKX03_003808 [Papaver bracteatum]|nr:hypothetical protein MKX03_003808 [Papaver bracteatum]
MGSNQTPAKQRYVGFSPDKVEINRSYAPSSTSAYFDLLNSAYTGNLDRFKRSLIFAAAGSVNVCRYLIEELNFDIDVQDNHGGTPLCYGDVKGHLNSLEYLLEKGANPNGSNDPNSTFNAPLHYAVLGGDINIQRLLLSKGARVNFVTAAGTSLYYAAGRDQLDSVKLLLDHHANVQKGLNLLVAQSVIVFSEGCLEMFCE